MPTGRSTIYETSKGTARRQKQRDKAERRNWRKQDTRLRSIVDEMAELRQHAAAQAALFNIGVEEKMTLQTKSVPDKANARMIFDGSSTKARCFRGRNDTHHISGSLGGGKRGGNPITRGRISRERAFVDLNARSSQKTSLKR